MLPTRTNFSAMDFKFAHGAHRVHANSMTFVRLSLTYPKEGSQRQEDRASVLQCDPAHVGVHASKQTSICKHRRTKARDRLEQTPALPEGFGQLRFWALRALHSVFKKVFPGITQWSHV